MKRFSMVLLISRFSPGVGGLLSTRLRTRLIAVCLFVLTIGISALPAQAQTQAFWIDGDRIKAAELPGGAPSTVVTAQSDGRPIYLDTHGDRLYWTSYQRPELWSSDFSGDDVRLEVNTETGSRGIAFDGNDVYWSGSGKVCRWDLSGTGIVWEVYNGPEGDGSSPDDIDVYDGRVYWTCWTSNVVRSCNLVGDDLRTTQLAGSVSRAFALEVENDHIYVVDDPSGSNNGRIMEFSMDGQDYRVLANRDAYDLSLCGDRVYYNDATTNKIYSVPLSGGEERVEINARSWKIAVIPEPSTLTLSLGLLAIAPLTLRRRRTRASREPGSHNRGRRFAQTALLLGTTLVASHVNAAEPLLIHTTAELSQSRYGLAATSVGNLALFGGGSQGRGHGYTRVDIYDADTALWSTAELSHARSSLAATSVGNKAIFAGGAGGYNLDIPVDDVDIFDSDTGTWTTARLSQERYRLAAATVGDKAYFAGGVVATSAGRPSVRSTVVDVYDAQTEQWSVMHMPHSRSDFSLLAIDDKLLFVGGETPIIDVYDTASGIWSNAPSPISYRRQGMAAAVAGDKALFVGGIASAQYNSAIDIYDSSIDTWSSSNLPSNAGYMAGTSLDRFGLFGGGAYTSYLKTVHIFDPIDSTWSETQLSVGGFNVAATTVGNTAIFAGGYGRGSTVDMYTLVPEPSSLALLCMGLLASLAYAWRRRRPAAAVLVIALFLLPDTAAQAVTTADDAGTYGQWIYWAENDGHVIRRVESDGSNLEVLANTEPNPLGIDVDVNAGYVYWSDIGNSSGRGRIHRANLDGTQQVTLYTASLPRGQESTGQIALHSEAQYLYWIDEEGEKLRRMRFDGSDVTTILDTSLGTALEIDPVNGHLYFTSGRYQQATKIERIDLDGSNRQVIADQYAYSLGLDIENEQIYAADWHDHKIVKTGFDGTGATVVLSGMASPRDVQVFDNHLYYADYGAQWNWMRAELDGSNPIVFCEIPSAERPLDMIQFVLIPEPSTFVLLCMGVAGLLVHARRRRGWAA